MTLAAGLTLVVATLLSAGPAAAQAVYRCGNTYGAVPCSQGKAVDADDRRTAAQRDEALRIVAAEKRQGDEMERARLVREAAIRPALAGALSAAPAAAATATPAGKKQHAKRQAKPKVKERRVAALTTRERKN